MCIVDISSKCVIDGNSRKVHQHDATETLMNINSCDQPEEEEEEVDPAELLFEFVLLLKVRYFRALPIFYVPLTRPFDRAQAVVPCERSL
jgi:hypothetical protein